MKATLKLIPLTDPTSAGLYLKSFDPYYQDEWRLGLGKAELTAELSEAMIFENGLEASKFWRQQSPTVPLRPDGKPNRPLTAFSALIEPIE